MGVPAGAHSPNHEEDGAVSYVETSTVLQGYEWPFDPEDPTRGLPWLQDQIDEAELILERRLGDLAAWADADATGLRARAVQRVVTRMVRRVMRNPEGMTSETEGDYSYRLDPRVASGSVWVTDDDWVLLGVAPRRAGSIRLATGARTTS